MASVLADDVVVGFTTRLGGVSQDRYAEANLSTRVGDDTAAVRENRRRTLSSRGLAGLPLVTTRQEHTATVVRVSSDELGNVDESVPLRVAADGMVTTERGVALLVGTADCLPVILVDPGRAVAVLHAGWRGLLGGIVETAVDRMREVGASPGSIIALLGPAIGPCCYAVDADLRDRIGARYESAAAVTRRGGPAVDLAAAARAALTRRGVVEPLEDRRCTYDDGDFFSRRRDGHTGCQGGLVAMR